MKAVASSAERRDLFAATVTWLPATVRQSASAWFPIIKVVEACFRAQSAAGDALYDFAVPVRARQIVIGNKKGN